MDNLNFFQRPHGMAVHISKSFSLKNHAVISFLVQLIYFFDFLFKISINIIASGGVGSKEDILELLQIEDKKLEGVICGKAIYEGKINVVEILRILSRESSVKN